jgi:phenylacetate-coenzyme A ligase PaaK-like adenylate-forming protein
MNITPINAWLVQKTGLFGNLNPETLRNWQIQKLDTLIKHASKNTAFYKDKLNITSNITELPFTNPSDIVNNPFSFLAIPQSLVARVTTLANSGTTSFKKRIFFSKADIERTIEFFAVGMSTMVNKYDRVQILISNKTENSLGTLLKESLSRINVASEITGVIKNANIAIEASRGADCLIGMPAEILYLSCIAPEMRPKSVLLSADYVPQSIIDRIKKTWNCKVYSHYGHTEFGYGFAVDCQQHQGYHLRDADFIVEIIDLKTQKPTKTGERGEIVVTTLSNEAMPLIRYRTGNISSIIDTPCTCGCNLPRLGKIEGRIESNISIGDDSISIHQLDELIFAIPTVRGFNAILIQESNILHLEIEADGIIDKDLLHAQLPKALTIEIQYRNADPFIHRAKRRIQLG